MAGNAAVLTADSVCPSTSRWLRCDVCGGGSYFECNNNNFTGTIPNDISKVTTLSSFDVSSNSLTGTIPTGLTALTLLT